MRLRKRPGLVGEEHDPELAHHRVERAVREGQLHGVRLAPFHGPPGPERGRLVEHRLIQIGGDDRGALRQGRGQGPRHDAGAGGHFQHAARRPRREPAHQVRRVRLEEQRDQVRLVELRDRPREDLVAACAAHRLAPS